MNSLLGFTSSYALNAVWEIVFIFLAGCVGSRILRRLGPQAEHTVWVAALIAAVISPALPMLRQAQDLIPLSPGGGVAMKLVAAPGSAAARAGILSVPLGWLWVLAGMYLAAVLFFAGRFLLSLAGAVQLLRQASPALLGGEQEEIWERCGRAFSLREARIMTSADGTGPMALDLRGPVLLMPADFAAHCSSEQFLAALAHECAHIERRDFQKNLFYETVSLAVAFHPLVWAIKSQIAQTREMICDRMATGHVDSLSYARSLLRLAEMMAIGSQISTIHAIGIFDAGILEKRIMRIRMKKHDPGALARWCLMTAAAAMLVSAAVGVAAMAVVVAPQASGKDSVQPGRYGHVYHVGHGVSAPAPLNPVLAKFPKAVRYDKKVPGGIVLLRLIVDSQGRPQDVHVVRSYRPDFDAEAMKAAEKYRFKPAMLKGKPVPVSIKMEVNFKRY